MKININKEKSVILESPQIIGSGAEGIVYNLPNSNEVVKIYHPKERNRQRAFKLNYLIANKPTLENQDSIIFPKKLVYDEEGQFAGFLMDKVEDTIDLTLLCNLYPSEKLTLDWQEKFSRKTKKGMLNRLRLCHNIAVALQKIYETQKYIIVDIKPENIRVRLDGKIFIIDMDSVEVINENRLLFYAEKLTPEYSPAEIKRLDSRKDVIPLSWDYFSMSVVFYKIMLGLHPFVGTCHEPYEECNSISQKISKGLFPLGRNKKHFRVIPEPHQNFYALPKSIQNLFLQCFDTGFHNPNKRPNTKKWIAEIQKIEENDFKEGKVIEKQIQKPKSKIRKKKKIQDDELVIDIKQIFKKKRQLYIKEGIIGFYVILILFLSLIWFASNRLKFEENFGKKNKEKEEEKYASLYDKYKVKNLFLVKTADENSNLLVLDKNHKYGIVNSKYREVVIPCQYDSLSLFQEGLAKFKKHIFYGFIDKKNTIVISAKYHQAFSFYEGKTIVIKTRIQNGKEQLYYISLSNKGEELHQLQSLENYDEINEVMPGYLSVKKRGKYGLLDYEAKRILPNIYTHIYDFTPPNDSKKLLAINNGKGWGISNLRGKLIIPCKYPSLPELLKQEYESQD